MIYIDGWRNKKVLLICISNDILLLSYQERFDLMKKDSQFVVRLPRKDLERLNEIVKKKAINRSELFRQWVKEYIEEEKSNGKNNE